MKIHLRLTGEDQSFPLTRNLAYISALKNYDIEFVSGGQDVILIHAAALDENMLKTKQPIIILERTDSTNIIRRAELKLPFVRGLIKNTILRPLELNNDTYCYGRYHNKIVQSLIPDKNNPLCSIPLSHADPKLTDQDMRKLHLGFSFCHYDKLNNFAVSKPNLKLERKNDIHFIGTTSYGTNLLATYHRTLAVQKINQLKNATKIHGMGRSQSAPQYLTALMNTKIVLSPWGHGEACYRDFEALFCGCILLKPDSSFVNCWPDIYQNNKTYIPCKADFSDLQDKVDWIKGHWNQLIDFRHQNLRLVHAAKRPEDFAKHMSKVFHDCMERVI